MELSIATARKRHAVSLANATRFLALSCLAWLSVDTIVWVAWDDVRPFASAPWLINAMQYASTIIVFAGVQRWLMRRWLRVQPPGWLGCSIAGALAGAAGYILFRSAVPAPYEFWQYMRYSPPPEPFTCSPKTSTLA